MRGYLNTSTAFAYRSVDSHWEHHHVHRRQNNRYSPRHFMAHAHDNPRCAAVALFHGPARAAGDAAAGKTVFETQCSVCHSAEAGKNGFGPSLAAVLDRKAGSLAGFNYSPAMAQAGLTWDEKTLDEFLTSSTQKVPGTAMSVALPNATDRANVIAYLETLGHASAAAAHRRRDVVRRHAIDSGPDAGRVAARGAGQAELALREQGLHRSALRRALARSRPRMPHNCGPSASSARTSPAPRRPTRWSTRA